jgi:hypothetical protein
MKMSLDTDAEEGKIGEESERVDASLKGKLTEQEIARAARETRDEP